MPEQKDRAVGVVLVRPGVEAGARAERTVEEHGLKVEGVSGVGVVVGGVAEEGGVVRRRRMGVMVGEASFVFAGGAAEEGLVFAVDEEEHGDEPHGEFFGGVACGFDGSLGQLMLQ
mmetsp:Transcript_3588/g.8325  ORF Transcript_3588/g.8325 Transcript_3588/m.8325 type:complete len:116 (+) Transcript_3588:158-505(+)